MQRNAKRFDHIHIVKSFCLKRHHPTAHFTHFLLAVPLFFHHKLRHQNNKRSTSKCNPCHDLIVIKKHKKCCQKMIECDHDRRKPADGIAAHCFNILIETAEHIAVLILAQFQPADIQNLFKKICPNIIADVRIQFYHNTADTAIQNQADCKTSCHNSKNHARFVHLISGNNINQIFSCNAAEKSKRGTYHSEKCIKKDGPSISDTVMQNPFPVIKDFLKCPIFPFSCCSYCFVMYFLTAFF